jgi:hypothetical protein
LNIFVISILGETLSARAQRLVFAVRFLRKANRFGLSPSNPIE